MWPVGFLCQICVYALSRACVCVGLRTKTVLSKLKSSGNGRRQGQEPLSWPHIWNSIPDFNCTESNRIDFFNYNSALDFHLSPTIQSMSRSWNLILKNFNYLMSNYFYNFVITWIECIVYQIIIEGSAKERLQKEIRFNFYSLELNLRPVDSDNATLCYYSKSSAQQFYVSFHVSCKNRMANTVILSYQCLFPLFREKSDIEFDNPPPPSSPLSMYYLFI